MVVKIVDNDTGEVLYFDGVLVLKTMLKMKATYKKEGGLRFVYKAHDREHAMTVHRVVGFPEEGALVMGLHIERKHDNFLVAAPYVNCGVYALGPDGKNLDKVM